MVRGIQVKNDWVFAVNPFAQDGQEKESWFRIDENGFMVTGWFTDEDGRKYYLWNISDNTKGRMVSGWQSIDGKAYHFNEVHDGTFGALIEE